MDSGVRENDMSTKVNGDTGVNKVLSAAVVPYDNTSSGLTATNVQEAVDQTVITLGTAVTLSGQTAVDFTGIPATAKRVAVMFNGVSTNGSSSVQLQLGASGGIENSGYLATCTVLSSSTIGSVNSTSGFQLYLGGSDVASATRSRHVTINLLEGSKWVATGGVGLSNVAAMAELKGSKTLSDTLTTVRVTTVNGTDQFDAGSINISWES